MAAAFNTWRANWEACTKDTSALVHYYGGLLDRGWLAWREFVEGAELERRRKEVCEGVVAAWRAHVAWKRQVRKDEGEGVRG
jgi:hypothetical protein